MIRRRYRQMVIILKRYKRRDIRISGNAFVVLTAWYWAKRHAEEKLNVEKNKLAHSARRTNKKEKAKEKGNVGTASAVC